MKNEIELDNGFQTTIPLIEKNQSQLKRQNTAKRTSSIYEGRKGILDSVLDHEKSSLSDFQSIDELRHQLPQISLQNKLLLLKKSVCEGEVQDFLIIFEHLENLEEKPKLNGKVDQKEQTLLHVACFKNLSVVVEKLLQFEKANSTQNEFDQWVNLLNNEGFASIHFAAYMGSLTNLELLQKYGANVGIKNSQGQNLISIAAQFDQVQAMIWLYLQGQSFIEQDNQGGTPLHWATYFDSYFALQFLLTWIKNLPNSGYYINLKDGEGMTPLHLAAQTGNIRIAKKLIQKGADKTIKNANNFTPAQDALENEQDAVYELLQDSNCLFDFLNIKQSLKPPSISWSQIIGFFLIYFFCMIGSILFVYPFYSERFWLQYLSLLSFILGIIFYFLTMFLSPGFVKKNLDQQNLYQLIKEVEPWEICSECLIKKPQRSRHCDYCKKCVIVYDHHCPWVNNCIGAQNYGIYFCFIFLIWINLLHIITINCIFIGRQYESSEPNYYYPWFNNFYDSTTLKITKIIIQGLIIILCLIFLIAVSHLLYGQTITLFTNETTFEKYKQQEHFQDNQGKSKSQKSLKQQQSLQINQKQCEFNNCIIMCCENGKNINYK